MTIGDRLRNLREHIGLTQEDVGKRIGVSKATVNRYETGEIDIKRTIAIKLADVFNVSPAYIMGWSDEKTLKVPSNIMPVDPSQFCDVPIIGRVAAGLQCFAETNIIGCQPTQRSALTGDDPYVYLRVIGDSMYPKLEDGDLVLVRCQSSVDSGAIAVVIVDDEDGVIKRIIYGEDWIELHSVNPMYPIRRFEGEDVTRIRVFGLVRQCVRNFN